MSGKQESLEKTIARNAASPKSVQIDGQTVEQHSLSDVIKADQYLSAKKAVKSRNCGLKFTRMSHSGG